MDQPYATLQAAASTSATGAAPLHRATYLARKVPEITIFFWIIKLLTTAMGETTSDYLVKQIDPVIAVAIGGACFVVALILQLAVRRYVAWIYWLAVIMVAVFGTMCADVLHVQFGVPYQVSSAVFAVALAAIFIAWYASEKTLSIHTIDTRRRELFYWAAVITTFALGTATGDLTAISLHLGYFTSGLFFAAVFALPALGYRLVGLNGIFAFWFAYILTRPLGASFADWFGKSHDLGGLGLGEGPVSLVLTGVIIILVAYVTVTRVDVKGDAKRHLG